MHSSGRRTACLMTIYPYSLDRGDMYPSIQLAGGCLPVGVSAQEGVSAMGALPRGVCVEQTGGCSPAREGLPEERVFACQVVSAKGDICLPGGGCLPARPPCGQNDRCKKHFLAATTLLMVIISHHVLKKNFGF